MENRCKAKTRFGERMGGIDRMEVKNIAFEVECPELDEIRDKALEISRKLEEIKMLAGDLASIMNVLKIKIDPIFRESMVVRRQ